MLLTFVIYKKDKRAKTGERFIDSYDTPDYDTIEDAEAFAKEEYKGIKLRYEIHQTMVERVNIMTGKTFTERYDTPACCSPAFETYFSM